MIFLVTILLIFMVLVIFCPICDNPWVRDEPEETVDWVEYED